MLLLNKQLGETPLQTITRFKQDNPEYQDKKLGYAGRLDPMAEGLLLVLVDDENKKRKEYEALKKTYEFQILWGVATDSYDLLGKITKTINTPSNPAEKIAAILLSFVGEYNQLYPPYSSQPVDGKPLFWWARQGRLSEITIPEKLIHIYNLSYEKTENIDKQTLQKIIIDRINLVKGDFRQEEIITIWKSFFESTEQASWYISSFTITCSSGTYVRSLVKRIGDELNTSTLAFNIKRTAILNV